MGARLLRLEIQRSCQTSRQVSILAKEGRFGAKNPPESQTLIVLSVMPPLTILEPSGENWTEEIEPNGPLACAFCFSLTNVRESVGGQEASDLEEGTIWGKTRAPASQTLIVLS